MATHHRYKRGHTPRIQKGPKRPTQACGTKQNAICYMHLCQFCVIDQDSDEATGFIHLGVLIGANSSVNNLHDINRSGQVLKGTVTGERSFTLASVSVDQSQIFTPLSLKKKPSESYK